MFRKIILYTVLIVTALTMIVPFWWMIVTSLEAEANIMLPYPPRFIPEDITLQNYVNAMTEAPFFRFFVNSVIVATSVCVLQLLVGSMGGYAFAKGNFIGKKYFFIVVLATMMIPLHIRIIPMFDLVLKFGMVNSYMGLILPAVPVAYGTYLLRQYIMTIPDELLDACRIDGWSELRIYANLILPLAKPAMATLALLSFLGNWNSFLWPLIVIMDNDLYTIPLGLMNFRQQFTAEWGNLMAATTLAMIPIVVLFIFTQRYITEGIALSGLKG